MKKYEIEYKHNSYIVNFDVINPDKPSPIERVFKTIFVGCIDSCSGNLEKTTNLINNNNLNIVIKNIQVKE